MSKFRERAAEVKAAGEEARGDFTPNGVPKRMYQWWLENSPSEKADSIRTGVRRENFCHFWRVVVIWVPLMWLAIKILDPVMSAAEKVNPKAAGAAFVVLLIGIVALIAIGTGTWMQVLMAVGVILAIALAVVAIAALIYFLNEKTESGVEILMVTIVTAAVLVFLGALIADFGILWVLMWAAIIAVCVAAFFAGAIFIGAVIENLRADRRKRANEASEAAWEAYVNDEGPHPYERKPKEPNAVQRFFRGVGDFLILATQVVRVNKWKICPLVEVEVPAKRPVERQYEF